MKGKKLRMINLGIMAVVVISAGAQISINAQAPPIYPDGNKIDGVWESQLTYRNCITGAVLFTSSSLTAYAEGGVMHAVTFGAPPSLRYPGLGVWRHVQGREYESTFKEFRYNADGTFAGKVIAVVQITHELDDTLTTSAVGRFYNAAGTLVGTVCPSGTAARFTGEN